MIVKNYYVPQEQEYKILFNKLLRRHTDHTKLDLRTGEWIVQYTSCMFFDFFYNVF